MPVITRVAVLVVNHTESSEVAVPLLGPVHVQHHHRAERRQQSEGLQNSREQSVHPDAHHEPVSAVGKAAEKNDRKAGEKTSTEGSRSG